ncbi:MAG: ABATE domain-containing protein [Segetibacter sp.]
MVKKEISEIRLDGGLLCLEFVNSVPNRIEIPQPDYLADIHDLIVWARRLEVIDAKTERLLTREANKEPEAANFFFKEAIAFRECLYSVFWHVSVVKKFPATFYIVIINLSDPISLSCN